MKTRSKMATFLAAVALGAGILAGSALPSQAQTATFQPQATIQIAQPSPTTFGNWSWPMMWWPAASNTTATTTTTTPGTTSQPTSFWGGWGGWWW